MKKLVQFLAVIVLFTCSCAYAQTTPPSKESLDKLFELTEVRAMIPQMQSQLDGMMSNMTQEMLKGKTLTDEQKKSLDVFRDKIIKISKEEISWDAIGPHVAQIYSDTLSQQDVDGMIAFYQSPAGQSFIKKMPQIMTQTMQVMQKISIPMMKKIEAAGNELQTDLQKSVVNK